LLAKRSDVAANQQKKYFASQNIFLFLAVFFLEKYGQKVKSN
jgi:hypothetical protein